MGKMLGRAVLCGLAGLIGWILTEPMMPGIPNSPDWAAAELRMVFAVFALIGLTAGIHQGLARGGKLAAGFGAALGLVFGLIGGLLGYQVGGQVALALFGPNWLMSAAVIPARAIVFSCLGLGLGAGIGLTQFRARILIAGLFGGLVGGLVSGLMFDPLATAIGSLLPRASIEGAEIGGPGRAVLWTVLGLSVGLFTALVETATRQAWVRLVVGRNEGREWPIDAAKTYLGRDERAHIPLFGDANVAPLHATIERQGANYILRDEGSPIGTGYQGVRMTGPVSLQPDDTFQIGSHQLKFLVKAGAARKIREGRAVAVSVGAPAMASQPVSNPTVAVAAQAKTMSVVALDGPIVGQRFAITAPVEVGREVAGIALAFDAQVSRRHASLEASPTGIHVRDLGSTNGTYLDGSRVTDAVAGPGSVIKIGSTSFRVESS